MVSIAHSLKRLGVDRKRLAKRTGLNPERVDELFGGAMPNTNELRLIAAHLHLPVDALVRSFEGAGQSDYRYRKSSGKSSLTAEARVQEIEALLSRRKLTPFAGEQWLVSASLDNRRSIETAAEAIRHKLCEHGERLDPLPDIVERVDRVGLAYSITLHDLDVEGASTRLHGCGLMVVAARTHKPRMLFTLAHELSHLVLGHNKPGKWIIDQNTVEAFDSANEEERLCNSLASALLQPAEGVARFLKLVREQFGIGSDVLTATEVFLVARYFCTSFFAAAMRLEHLDIAPAGSASSFEKAITTDHKSLEAYARKLGLPEPTKIEMPVLSPTLRRAVSSAVERGDISIGRVSDIIGYSTVEMAHALA
jgi:Zn-dependent peptidase ImmA (M78 family)